MRPNNAYRAGVMLAMALAVGAVSVGLEAVGEGQSGPQDQAVDRCAQELTNRANSGSRARGGQPNQDKPVFYSGGIFNRASGKALDVEGRSTRDAANVQQWDFGSAPNQLWDIVDQGTGQYAILSRCSGKALDVTGRSAADGANIQQFSFGNGDNQRWRLQSVPGGYYLIVSVSSGKCLDVEGGRVLENGANVQQWSCGGAANQQWQLRR